MLNETRMIFRVYMKNFYVLLLLVFMNLHANIDKSEIENDFFRLEDFLSIEQIELVYNIPVPSSNEEFTLEMFAEEIVAMELVELDNLLIANRNYPKQIERSMNLKSDFLRYFPNDDYFEFSEKIISLEQIVQELKDLETIEIRNMAHFKEDTFNDFNEFSDEELRKRMYFAFEQSVKFYELAYKEVLKIKEKRIQMYAKELFVTAVAGYASGGLRGAVSCSLYTGLASLVYDNCVHLSKSIEHVKISKKWDDYFDRYYEAIMKRRNANVKLMHKRISDLLEK